MKEKPVHRTFRPTAKVQEQIEQVEGLDLNVSEVINGVLENHLEAHLAKDLTQRQSKINAALKKLEEGQRNVGQLSKEWGAWPG